MFKRLVVISILIIILLPLSVLADPWASKPKYSCSVKSTTVCGSAGCAKTKTVKCTMRAKVKRYDVYWLWWKIGTIVAPFTAVKYASVRVYNYNNPPVKLYISSGKKGKMKAYMLFCANLPFPLPGGRRTSCFRYNIGRRFYVKGGKAATLILMRKWGIMIDGGGASWMCSIPGMSCRQTTPTSVKAWFSVLIFPKSVESGSIVSAEEPGVTVVKLFDDVILLVIYNPLPEPIMFTGVEVDGATLEYVPQPVLVQPNNTEVIFLKLKNKSSYVEIKSFIKSTGNYNYTISVALGENAEGQNIYPLMYMAIILVVVVSIFFGLRAVKHTVRGELERKRKFVKRKQLDKNLIY